MIASVRGNCLLNMCINKNKPIHLRRSTFQRYPSLTCQHISHKFSYTGDTIDVMYKSDQVFTYDRAE
jgi:hypothetical protein